MSTINELLEDFEEAVRFESDPRSRALERLNLQEARQAVTAEIKRMQDSGQLDLKPESRANL